MKSTRRFCLRRFDAERDRQVRLAGADRAGEDQILRRGDPLAARERVDLRRADALGGGEIKRVERLHLGKARLAEPLPDHRLVPRGLLGAEDLVQIVFVRPVRIARLPGERLQTCARRRAASGARVCATTRSRVSGGAHAATSPSQPS